MNKIFTVLAICLSVSTTTFATTTQYPGGSMPDSTPADIESKPQKYYPPQTTPPTSDEDQAIAPNQ